MTATGAPPIGAVRYHAVITFFVLFYCYQLCMFNSRLVSDHAHRMIVNCPKGLTAEGR